MTKHEQLKEICDKIGYLVDAHYSKENGFYWEYGCEYCNSNCTIEILDVIEIIFTPEFMDKYKEYFYNFYKDKYNHIGLNLKWNDFKLGFFNYLDKPVEYLYNIIK